MVSRAWGGGHGVVLYHKQRDLLFLRLVIHVLYRLVPPRKDQAGGGCGQGGELYVGTVSADDDRLALHASEIGLAAVHDVAADEVVLNQVLGLLLAQYPPAVQASRYLSDGSRRHQPVLWQRSQQLRPPRPRWPPPGHAGRPGPCTGVTEFISTPCRLSPKGRHPSRTASAVVSGR